MRHCIGSDEKNPGGLDDESMTRAKWVCYATREKDLKIFVFNFIRDMSLFQLQKIWPVQCPVHSARSKLRPKNAKRLSLHSSKEEETIIFSCYDIV